MRDRVAGTLAAALILTGLGGPARAQAPQYPPLTCSVDVDADITDFDPLRMRVLVEVVCNASGTSEPVPGVPVEVFMESVRVKLGEGVTNSQGIYVLERGIPCSIAPGPHQVIVDVQDLGSFTEPVTVPDRRDCGGGGALPVAAGGGGITEARGGGGSLPFTGGNILLLVLWALALISVGTALALYAWRRARHIEVVRALSARLHGRRLPLALPPPEVPRLDTAGFAPLQPRVPRSTPSETDPPGAG